MKLAILYVELSKLKLEDNVLLAISLTEIGMTGLFVIIVNFWIWRKEKENPKESKGITSLILRKILYNIFV